MTARSFGRKAVPDSGPGASPADEMSRRVQAFVAAERARKAQGGSSGDEPPLLVSDSSRPTGREKSMAMAYVLWFVMGTTGAHRFYLGFPVSGVLLMCAWYSSLFMLLTGHLGAVYTLGLAGLWMLSDALMIPRLLDKANGRLRRNAAYAAV